MATKAIVPKKPAKTGAGAGASAVAAAGSSSLSLIDSILSVADAVGATETKDFTPIPTDCDVLNAHFARYYPSAADPSGFQCHMGISPGKMVGIIGQTGSGKSHPVSELIPTPTGYKTIGDIRVDSEVLGRNGLPQRVVGVYPRGIMQTYLVTFNDGSTTRTGYDHLWSVRRAGQAGWVTTTTGDMFTSGVSDGGAPQWEIPVAAPVSVYHDPDLKYATDIDAYTIGTLLAGGKMDGDTNHRGVRVTFKTAARARFANANFAHGNLRLNNSERARLISACTWVLNDGEIATSIPTHIIVNGTLADRMWVLRGMMDVAGEIVGDKAILQVHGPRFARGVRELVSSLGGVAIPRFDSTKPEGQKWSVEIQMTSSPFAFEDATEEWKTIARFTQPRRWVTAIECLEDYYEPHVCIMVSNADHLYLIGEDHVVTHNTTMAIQIAAAIVDPFDQGLIVHIDLEDATRPARVGDITGWSPERVARKYRRSKAISLQKIYSLIKNTLKLKEEALKRDPSLMVYEERTGETIPVPTVFIIDTVAALQMDGVMDGEEFGSMMYEKGQQAGANNALAQRLAGMIGETNTTIIWVNHIRVKVQEGPMREAKAVQHLGQNDTTPGGTGFPQYADTYIKMTPTESLTPEEGMKIRGSIVQVTILKTRTSWAGRKFRVVLSERGFENAWSNLQFLKENKLVSGAGAHLKLVAPESGRTSRTFAQAQFRDLYEHDEEFRSIADELLGVHLGALIPLPGNEASQADELTAEDLEGTEEMISIVPPTA